VSTTEEVPQPQPLDYQKRPKKLWHAGTLTYTQSGLIFLFLWLLGGDFSWQLRDRSIAPTMPLLLRKFGGSDFIAGLLLGTLPALMGILIAPIVCYRSDRHRSRWGRRIPFLLIPAPFAFASMVGLAFTPVIGKWVHQTIGAPHSPSQTACVIGVFAFFWTIFEVAAVIYFSLHGALVNDVVPRPVLGRVFGLFRVVSLGAGILFSYFLFGKVENHYIAMFIGIGTLYLVCFSAMCLKVKEGQYPPPPPMMKHPYGPLGAAVESYVRDCFTIPYYLWFFLSFTLAHMAFAPVNLFSVYYYQSVGMTSNAYGKFSALQFVCSMIQAPILGWLSDKFHPIRTTIFALIMYALVTLLAFFFVRDWRTFAAAHVICGTCSGIWLTATAPLAPALLPKMKFATFASALGVCTALGTLIASPVVGRLLDFVNQGKPPTARDYHYIYIWAATFITLSLIVTLIVYKKFQTYGGPTHYTAPESSQPH
jgi:MFS family permease